MYEQTDADLVGNVLQNSVAILFAVRLGDGEGARRNDMARILYNLTHDFELNDAGEHEAFHGCGGARFDMRGKRAFFSTSIRW